MLAILFKVALVTPRYGIQVKSAVIYPFKIYVPINWNLCICDCCLNEKVGDVKRNNVLWPSCVNLRCG